MLIKIESTQTQTRKGIKDGREWSITSQEALVQMNGEIRRVPLTIPENTSSWQAGNYTLDIDKSLFFGRYGLELSRSLFLVASPNKPA